MSTPKPGDRVRVKTPSGLPLVSVVEPDGSYLGQVYVTTGKGAVEVLKAAPDAPVIRYFVAPDAYDSPALWHGTGPDDDRCQLVACKGSLDDMHPALWPAAVKGLTETAPTPAPGAAVNAMVRAALDGTGERYPTRIVVFCDRCGRDHAGEYIVTDALNGPARLEIARSHMRAQGWSCDERGDLCPNCAS